MSITITINSCKECPALVQLRGYRKKYKKSRGDCTVVINRTHHCNLSCMKRIFAKDLDRIPYWCMLKKRLNENNA